MTDTKCQQLYFEWLCDFVSKDYEYDDKSYYKLLLSLHNTKYEYRIFMDSNREGDGVALRYLFAKENNIPQYKARLAIDNDDCSMLEMMVALANRIETQIMTDSHYCDRTPQWFWEMITNLGLMNFDDEHFDEHSFIFIMQRFINADYSPEGVGGLFYIPYTKRDLRAVEIWYQAMQYLKKYI